MDGVLHLRGSASSSKERVQDISKYCNLFLEPLIPLIHRVHWIIAWKYLLMVLSWKKCHSYEFVGMQHNQLRDKMRKIPFPHRQGLKIRTSNVLSQPEFVGCSVSYYSISLHSRFYLDSQTTYFYGRITIKGAWVYLCAGWPREKQFGTQLNTTLWSTYTNLERNFWTRAVKLVSLRLVRIPKSLEESLKPTDLNVSDTS
ncbi:hypothetical protein ACHWQZ_G005579 [Mnemiopsis leidyi]